MMKSAFIMPMYFTHFRMFLHIRFRHVISNHFDFKPLRKNGFHWTFEVMKKDEYFGQLGHAALNIKLN